MDFCLFIFKIFLDKWSEQNDDVIDDLFYYFKMEKLEY